MPFRGLDSIITHIYILLKNILSVKTYGTILIKYFNRRVIMPKIYSSSMRIS